MPMNIYPSMTPTLIALDGSPLDNTGCPTIGPRGTTPFPPPTYDWPAMNWHFTFESWDQHSPAVYRRTT